ncbi:MAG: response regulator, partial [Asgard group archaeon]|nr:response regulator [Asgard group archaeon]
MTKSDNLSVIIAGDIPFLSAMIRMAVEDAGFIVKGQATNRESLLTLCQQNRPDIILLDMDIPDLDTVRLVEDLLDINDYLTIIAISKLEGGYGERALAAGARAIMLKPFSTYDLMDILRKVSPTR